MKATWLPPPKLKRPSPSDLDKLVRRSLWSLSKGGTCLVHRRTLDREVQRQLWHTGHDASWLGPGMELRESDQDLIQEYLGTLDVGESRRLSLVRSTLVDKWGPYYCCLPPRAIDLPTSSGTQFVLSLEPTKALAERIGSDSASIQRRGRLRLVRSSQPLPTQAWHEIVRIPEGLRDAQEKAALEWLRSEILHVTEGRQSMVLEGGARHPANHPKSLAAEFTAMTPSRDESLERLFTRPAGLWGGFSLDSTRRVVPGKQVHFATRRPTECLLVIDNDPRNRSLTSLTIRPYYRRLIMGMVGIFDHAERSVSFADQNGEITAFGKALRAAQGPLLTWLMLFGGVGTDDRGFAAITLPPAAWLVARQLLTLQGTQVSHV